MKITVNFTVHIYAEERLCDRTVNSCIVRIMELLGKK